MYFCHSSIAWRIVNHLSSSRIKELHNIHCLFFQVQLWMIGCYLEISLALLIKMRGHSFRLYKKILEMAIIKVHLGKNMLNHERKQNVMEYENFATPLKICYSLAPRTSPFGIRCVVLWAHEVLYEIRYTVSWFWPTVTPVYCIGNCLICPPVLLITNSILGVLSAAY